MGILSKILNKDEKDNPVVGGTIKLPDNYNKPNEHIVHELGDPKECKTTLKGIRRN